MAHVIQMPIASNPPAIERNNYPVTQLNPQAKENIFIGRRVSEISDLSEYKNIAISTLALGAIFLVGSIIAFSLGQEGLSSAFTFTGLSCGVGGSFYFVVRHFLNPVAKLESTREKMRCLPLEKILEKSLDEIEGLDLLKKAVEDKSTNPKDKVKTYTCLRQLKRNLENLKLAKRRFDENIHTQYSTRLRVLESWKEHEIRGIYQDNPRMAPQVIEADVKEVNRLFNENIENWQVWRSESLNRNNEQYRNAVDQLELQYQGVFRTLGVKTGFSRLAFWK